MIPGEHYEIFDVADLPGNEARFQQKMHSMLDDEQKLRTMACKGYQHGMKYHRVINRLDYIIRTMAYITNGEDYPETGAEVKKRLEAVSDAHREYAHKVANSTGPPPYFFSNAFAALG